MITDYRKDVIDKILTPMGYNIFRNEDMPADIPIVFTRDIVTDDFQNIRAGTIAYLHDIDSVSINKEKNCVSFEMIFHAVNTRENDSYAFDMIVLNCVTNANNEIILADSDKRLTDVIEHATETAATVLEKFRSTIDEYEHNIIRYNTNRETLNGVTAISVIFALFATICFVICNVFWVGLLCFCLIPVIYIGSKVWECICLSDDKLDEIFSNRFHELRTDVNRIEDTYANDFAAKAADEV